MVKRPKHRVATNRDSLGHSHCRFITAILATAEVVLVVAVIAFLIAIAMHKFLSFPKTLLGFKRATAALRHQFSPGLPLAAAPPVLSRRWFARSPRFTF